MFVSGLRRLWLRLLGKPVDLDKAIRSDLKTAKIYFVLSGFFFVLGLFMLVCFAVPVLMVVADASVSAYENLACVSGVTIVTAIPLMMGAWHYLLGVVYEQSALKNRVRKLERLLDAKPN